MADHWNESIVELTDETKNKSRAIKTLMEEIEAVMYYQQRVDVTSDVELRDIFAHNRDEEIEHACMTIEWLRRNMAGWDRELRTYLFSQGSILEAEVDATSGSVDGSTSANVRTDNEGGLSIGSLKL